MKKSQLLTFAGIVFFVSLIGLMLTSPKITGNVINENSEADNNQNQEIKINYDNFAEVLSKNKIVLDLPKKSKILLGEYGGNHSHTYLIERGRVSEVNEAENVDFEVKINFKYLEELTNDNYCDVLSKVIDKNDFKLKLYKSKLSLFWKYKSMMRYKECFGI